MTQFDLSHLFNVLDRKEEKLAQIIFGLRNQQQLSQDELAKKAGVTKQVLTTSEGYQPGFLDTDYEKIFTALGYSFNEVRKQVNKQ